MNILLVHQNFPGQYRELFRWLVAQRRHSLVFLTQRKDVTAVEGAEIVVYKPHHRPPKDAYALSSTGRIASATAMARHRPAKRSRRTGSARTSSLVMSVGGS
jgi:hypothetical protein